MEHSQVFGEVANIHTVLADVIGRARLPRSCRIELQAAQRRLRKALHVLEDRRQRTSAVTGEGDATDFRAAPKIAEASSTRGRLFPSGSSRVLIVDDDEGPRACLRAILESAGYAVGQARDGIEALKAMCHESYPIVLTDHCMPRMTGLQLLPLIRRVWPKTAVIIVSGDGDAYKKLACEAFAVVTKPYEVNQLLRVIRAAHQAYAEA